MASAQAHQQTEAAPDQAESKEQRPCPQALHEEAKAEPVVQIEERKTSNLQESGVSNKPQASNQPNESGECEKRVETQPSAAESQGHQASRGHNTKCKGQESAQLRARRLAIEAVEAQEAAQQAAKLAADKQVLALAAAKEAADEIDAEYEVAKAAALHDLEVVVERARKLQKLSDESSQDTFRHLLQTSAEETLRQAVDKKGDIAHPSGQSANGTDALEGDAFQSAARQFAVDATETVQHVMHSTVDKTAAEVAPLTHEQEDSEKVEQPTNPAPDSELPTGPETPTQPGSQMSFQSLADVPTLPPASSNGIEGHSLGPGTILTQNPLATTVVPMNTELDSSENPAGDFVGKAPEGDERSANPENQLTTEQAPSPMQVG